MCECTRRSSILHKIHQVVLPSVKRRKSCFPASIRTAHCLHPVKSRMHNRVHLATMSRLQQWPRDILLASYALNSAPTHATLSRRKLRQEQLSTGETMENPLWSCSCREYNLCTTMSRMPSSKSAFVELSFLHSRALPLRRSTRLC